MCRILKMSKATELTSGLGKPPCTWQRNSLFEFLRRLDGPVTSARLGGPGKLPYNETSWCIICQEKIDIFVSIHPWVVIISQGEKLYLCQVW